MKKQLAWILGGASIVGLGMIASLNACSGDTQTTDAGGKDVTTKDQATNDVVTQDQNTGDTAPPQDAGADCKTPSGPFTNADAGPFCPFQAGPDGGTVFSDCQNGEHCCVYPQNANKASTCNANATECTAPGTDAGTTDFRCQETNDCQGGNQVCCLKSPAHLQQDPGCLSYYYVSGLSGGGGTACENTACATGDTQICGSDSDCPTGKTCKSVNTKGIWIGACIGADGGI